MSWLDDRNREGYADQARGPGQPRCQPAGHCRRAADSRRGGALLEGGGRLTSLGARADRRVSNPNASSPLSCSPANTVTGETTADVAHLVIAQPLAEPYIQQQSARLCGEGHANAAARTPRVTPNLVCLYRKSNHPFLCQASLKLSMFATVLYSLNQGNNRYPDFRKRKRCSCHRAILSRPLQVAHSAKYLETLK